MHLDSVQRTVLVTGGAGYIGSHVVRLLLRRGVRVLVVDDLSTGDPRRVVGVPFVRLDLSGPDARDRLVAAMLEHAVDGVMHFAAMKQVGESIDAPTRYFDRNVGGLTNLLAAMESTRTTRLVFSSSAAVYGEPATTLVREDEPRRPVNPYGQTKLVGEWMIENAAAAWGLRAANLRYFNVAGAGWSDLADSSVTNLVPIVIAAVRAGRATTVFGGDWDTPDGSCVRDYIHVLDLARAHLAALDFLRASAPAAYAVNLGTGGGASVLDVVRAVAAVSGTEPHVELAPRRPGDPAAVVADPTLANTLLGWHAERSVADIVESAWSACSAAEQGAVDCPENAA
ncbi:UDP-glucose 4-epimerase GalE [Curtobacterium sp. RRHDQ10]|uniref:UDP-glucose 4-epimerase GalE n=1 Tax=Curtobacterium phyllosphaerae TaxID=3413379 RepID=UPI003BF0FAEA